MEGTQYSHFREALAKLTRMLENPKPQEAPVIQGYFMQVVRHSPPDYLEYLSNFTEGLGKIGLYPVYETDGETITVTVMKPPGRR